MTETAVVAGVGPGLGSSVARRFAEDGAAVGLFARSTEYIEELADDLDATTPGTAVAVPTDLTDGEAVADGFAAVRERFGPVDALAVTAFADGAGDGGGLFDAETADLAAAWETRVLGSFRCARAAAAADMRRGDGGTVLLTNSAAATTPSASLPAATARHALRGLARSMNADPKLGAAGVQTVHVVVDGWIDKPSLRAAYPDHERWMDPDEIADRLHGLAAAETVHAGEIDLRHPRDEPSF
jgi:NAD(P)-dependent dehydrogenase (short-subunit alcohol dehydrogenase family)